MSEGVSKNIYPTPLLDSEARREVCKFFMPLRLSRASLPKMKIRIMPSESGYSLLEMMLVLVLVSVLLSSTVSNLKELNRPLQNGTAQTVAFLKRVKARAVSSTSAYIVTPASANELITAVAVNCSTTTRTLDPDVSLTLPDGVSLTDTDWSLCFNSRGLAEENTVISLQDVNNIRSLQVYLGGGVREES